jgi:hypothetical protein
VRALFPAGARRAAPRSPPPAHLLRLVFLLFLLLLLLLRLLLLLLLLILLGVGLRGEGAQRDVSVRPRGGQGAPTVNRQGPGTRPAAGAGFRRRPALIPPRAAACPARREWPHRGGRGPSFLEQQRRPASLAHPSSRGPASKPACLRRRRWGRHAVVLWGRRCLQQRRTRHNDEAHGLVAPKPTGRIGWQYIVEA